MSAKLAEPRFPWALLVIMGMFGFIAFSSEPPWLQVAGGIGVAIVVAGAFYQLIPRRDDSDDWPEPGQDPGPDEDDHLGHDPDDDAGETP